MDLLSNPENKQTLDIENLLKGKLFHILEIHSNNLLNLASECGDFEVVEKLTKLGLDCNIANENGFTALNLGIKKTC